MWHHQWASVRGAGHREQGLPCQDRVRTLERNGVTAAALADGAGSARLSQVGAEIAVQLACQILCRDFTELSTNATPFTMRKAILEPIRAEIRNWADSHGVSSRDLACTLLAVAVRGDQYLVFHVGDGVIGYRKNGQMLVASHPDNGEFCNCTTFVTSRDAMLKSRVIRGSSSEIDGFFFLCDGCEPALFDKRRGRLAPICGNLIRRAELLDPQIAREQLEEVLSMAIAARTRDDCSLVLLTRRTEQFRPWGQLTQREQARVLGIRTQDRNRRRRMIRHYAREYGASAV